MRNGFLPAGQLNFALGFCELWGRIKGNGGARMNLFEFLNQQHSWSNEVFGRTENVAARLERLRKHIDSELQEIDEDRTNLEEWVDLMILSMEAALRAGHTPHAIVMALEAKQARNMARQWPQTPENEPSFHVCGSDDESDVWKGGKKAAGRRPDGVIHDASNNEGNK
jgi:hypothetical protein